MGELLKLGIEIGARRECGPSIMARAGQTGPPSKGMGKTSSAYADGPIAGDGSFVAAVQFLVRLL